MTARRKKGTGFFGTRNQQMIAAAGAVVALLVGLQQFGVFNHIDTPAWTSDLLKLAQSQAVTDYNLTVMQLQQRTLDLYRNQDAQASYARQRQQAPSFYREQQTQLEQEIARLKARQALDESAIRKGQ